MAKFLANAPADVKAGKVAGSKWLHGHAEFIERMVNSLDSRAFFDQELCLAPVWAKHAVTDKSHAVANQDANFANSLRKLHASSDHFFARSGTAHNFQQAHDIGGASKRWAYDRVRSAGRPNDFVRITTGGNSGHKLG